MPASRSADAIGSNPTDEPRTPACDVGSQVEDLEPSITAARQALGQVLSSPALPGLETLLFETTVITGYPYYTNQTLDQRAAADWLREGATPDLHLKQLQRHHHIPVLIAVTEGWRPEPPATTGCVTLYFHRYAPADEMADAMEYWKIDVIEPG